MSDLYDIESWSDAALLKEIGKFVRNKRVQQRLTQHELAEKAAMSRSTLSLLERGEGITLLNLIKILRILDVLYVLEGFKAVPQISPMQLAKEAKEEYQRVRKRKGESDISITNDDFEW